MGFLLAILVGAVWAGVGIVQGEAARRRVDPMAFMTAGSVLAAVAAWACLADWPVLAADRVERGGALVLVMAASGVASACGMLALQKAMDAGAAAWTVGQSAMAVPFLAGVLLLGVVLLAV